MKTTRLTQIIFGTTDFTDFHGLNIFLKNLSNLSNPWLPILLLLSSEVGEDFFHGSLGGLCLSS